MLELTLLGVDLPAEPSIHECVVCAKHDCLGTAEYTEAVLSCIRDAP